MNGYNIYVHNYVHVRIGRYIQLYLKMRLECTFDTYLYLFLCQATDQVVYRDKAERPHMRNRES